MNDQGYIYLERKIRDHWLWDDKPFAMAQAWIDLIFSANHEDKNIIWNGSKLTIRRGQFITSVSKLADRWGWNRKKVRRFLKALEMDNSLEVKVTTHGTTVTLVKYSDYQNKRTAKRTTKGQPMSQKRDSHVPQTRNDKELEGNIRKEEEEDDDGFMTPDEYAKGKGEHGSTV